MGAKPVISASKALTDIRAGLSDAQIMEKYSLSSRGLQSLIGKLVQMDLITQAELDSRNKSTNSTPGQISAKEIVAQIKGGMSDIALMTQYEITPQRLYGIFTKLKQSGYITQDDLDRRQAPVNLGGTVDLSIESAGAVFDPIGNNETRQQATPVQPSSNWFTCSHCGRPQNHDFIVCPECGTVAKKSSDKISHQNITPPIPELSNNQHVEVHEQESPSPDIVNPTQRWAIAFAALPLWILCLWIFAGSLNWPELLAVILLGPISFYKGISGLMTRFWPAKDLTKPLAIGTTGLLLVSLLIIVPIMGANRAANIQPIDTVKSRPGASYSESSQEIVEIDLDALTAYYLNPVQADAKYLGKRLRIIMMGKVEQKGNDVFVIYDFVEDRGAVARVPKAHSDALLGGDQGYWKLDCVCRGKKKGFVFLDDCRKPR